MSDVIVVATGSAPMTKFGVDRIKGLYGIADGSKGRDPVALGQALLDGGCRLIQLRCKTWLPDDLVRAGRELGSRCRAVGATFLVNDDVEVALACAADGAHVGPLDLDVHRARKHLGADLLLGFSTDTPDGIRAAIALPVDYLAFGPVFPTEHASRPKDVQGLTALTRVRGICPLPLVAIGGITAENLPHVRPYCDAWAVIGAIADARNPMKATRALL